MILFLIAFFLNGCMFSQSPTPSSQQKSILKGNVVKPIEKSKSKDIVGQALTDATVNVIDPKTGNVVATTITDANGSYHVEVPAGGPYIIQAIKENLKILDLSTVIQIGETIDLGTADATSTAQSLLFIGLVQKGENPENIDLTPYIDDSRFPELVQTILEILLNNGDPTINPPISNLVKIIISPSQIVHETPSLPARSTYVLTYTGLQESYEVGALVNTGGKSQAEINTAVENSIIGLPPIKITLATDKLGISGYQAVRFLPVSSGTHIQLWAKDTAGNWYDINTVGWGPIDGFELPARYSATTDVYFLANKGGEYPLTIKLVDLKNNNTLITQIKKTIITSAPPIYNETQDTYYETIHDALVAAQSYDSIIIAPGTYYEDSFEIDKPLTIKGSNYRSGDNYITQTTVKVATTGSTIVLVDNYTDHVYLSWITFDLNGTSGIAVLFHGMGGTDFVNSSVSDCKVIGTPGEAGTNQYCALQAFNGAQNVIFERNIIEGGIIPGEYGGGIGFIFAQNITIKDNIINGLGVSGTNGITGIIYGPSDITGNTITGCTNGIYQNQADMVIEHNKIYGNSTGISAGCGGWTTTINYNSIHDNPIALDCDISHIQNIDASYNWWGNIDGPVEGSIIGDVSYSPWAINENCTQFVSRVTANIDPEGSGNVTGAGNYSQGVEVTLTANPNPGYQFLNWTDSEDNIVGTNPTYSFTMGTGNVTYTAHFVLE
jgi:uncharacterized repeat protein (TIGR02543 family)